MLVDAEGNEIVDLTVCEPWTYGFRDLDGRIYPVTQITYKMNSIELQWATEDIETIRKRWNEELSKNGKWW